MEERFYYLRDPENKPIVTVCLLLDVQDGSYDDTIWMKTHVARGIAICSNLDAPNKKVGRAIAKGRALKALMNGSHSPMLREELDIIQEQLEDVDLLSIDNYKGETDPKLTKYETNLLRKV
jgi:hypothetical protein